MLPDRVSNPGPLTYESGALPIAQVARLKSFVIHLLEVKGGLLLSMIKLQNSLETHENELNILVLPIRTDSARLF